MSLLGLEERQARAVRLRLVQEPVTLTVRMACHGAELRSDGFAVLDVTEDGLRVRFWRDLPAGPRQRSRER